MRLLDELREQRWDDHRYYHHSRVNQSLHLLSALCFLGAYYYVFVDPVVAAVLGWLVAMVSRQIGHFFFEPHRYDDVNHLSHENKEAIKIGYNLQRKRILLAVWGLTPVAVYLAPGLLGLLEPWSGPYGYAHHLAVTWIALGFAALIARTVQLFFIRGVWTGLGWFLKIATDPINDVRQYWRAPLHLARGQLIDPMYEVQQQQRW